MKLVWDGPDHLVWVSQAGQRQGNKLRFWSLKMPQQAEITLLVSEKYHPVGVSIDQIVDISGAGVASDNEPSLRLL